MHQHNPRHCALQRPTGYVETHVQRSFFRPAACFSPQYHASGTLTGIIVAIEPNIRIMSIADVALLMPVQVEFRHLTDTNKDKDIQNSSLRLSSSILSGFVFREIPQVAAHPVKNMFQFDGPARTSALANSGKSSLPGFSRSVAG